MVMPLSSSDKVTAVNVCINSTHSNIMFDLFYSESMFIGWISAP